MANLSGAVFGALSYSCRAVALTAALLACIGPAVAAPPPLDFSLFRLGPGPHAVLVVGGIQGDEPGGFSAATLLATRYEIVSGSVWVAPNLNFPSIIRSSRGLFGDMNRKFARLDETDPEFPTVRRIQELIRMPDVRLVLNLHDGSGYYRPKFEDRLKNPSRWGQSVIIDQTEVSAGGEGVFLNSLEHEAQAVSEAVNRKALLPLHRLHVNNTNTARGNLEMEKSLSWYAVRQGKAAFGLEASKELPVEERVYYHLNMIEEFLRMAGVVFTRDFELTPKAIGMALRENLGVSFAQNRLFLPLEDARPSIRGLPLPRDAWSGAITSKPIMAVLPCRKNGAELCVHYGNRTITLIQPDWHELDEGLDGVRAVVDGREENVPFGGIVDVSDFAVVRAPAGYRVNAIGFDSGKRDESGLELRRKDFLERFSVDRQGSIFRVEVYGEKRFSGMFLLRFVKNKQASAAAGRRKS